MVLIKSMNYSGDNIFLKSNALIKNPEYSNINGVFLESKGERRWFILIRSKKK